MTILIAGFRYEANSFAPGRATLDASGAGAWSSATTCSLDAMRIVQVKSAGGFREHYEPIAAGVIDLAGVGPASSDLESLPFTRISRSLYPFDDIQEPA